MKVLIITKPIIKTIAEGSKKNAWQIASFTKNHEFYLMTYYDQIPNSKIHNANIILKNVYSNKKFNFFQKLRLVIFMIFENNRTDIYHYFFVPTLMTSHLFYYVTKFRKKNSIQSVPALYKTNINSKKINKLFFADVVVAYSEYTAKKLTNMGLRNVKQIAPGVNLNIYYKHPNKQKIKENYSGP